MPRLTLEQKRIARRLSNEGLSLREVARHVSCSPGHTDGHENTNGLLRQYMPKGTDLSVR